MSHEKGSPQCATHFPSLNPSPKSIPGFVSITSFNEKGKRVLERDFKPLSLPSPKLAFHGGSLKRYFGAGAGGGAIAWRKIPIQIGAIKSRIDKELDRSAKSKSLAKHFPSLNPSPKSIPCFVSITYLNDKGEPSFGEGLQTLVSPLSKTSFSRR